MTNIIFDKEQRLSLKPFDPIDIIQLNKMYRGLSNETKDFFHPTFFQARSGLVWVRDKTLLIVSGIRPVRELLMGIFPRAVYLALILRDSRNEIVAFIFYKIRKKLRLQQFEAENGIVLKEDYQGRGLGFKLLELGNKFAWQNHVTELYSLVNAKNERMLRLNQKSGFRVAAHALKVNLRNGRHYEALEMTLSLAKAKN
jgi:L-amino acid N-acyltransferase YncA